MKGKIPHTRFSFHSIKGLIVTQVIVLDRSCYFVKEKPIDFYI